MTLALQGIGVARGLALGRAYAPQRAYPEWREYAVPAAQIAEESRRYLAAIEAARRQLESVRVRVPAGMSMDIVSFIDVHLLMLQDKALAFEPLQHIRQSSCNAEWALRLSRDALMRGFDDIADPYLRARKEDVDHVVKRILRALHDQLPRGDAEELGAAVVFADDVEPAEAVLLYHQGAAAVVTEYGGYTSHTAILARSLALPMVTGVRGVCDYVRHGETVAVDGERGVVLVGADACVQAYFRSRQSVERSHRAALAKLRKRPAVTRDGVPIALNANIELPEDLPALAQAGAAGVGLYRTEFLFLNRAAPPDEAEQFKAYRRVLTALHGAPVTIRTVDVGADKPWYGPHAALPPSANPALGLRAIRHCLRYPELFRPQLRAILRASAHGPVRMMVPMVATTAELDQLDAILDEVRCELRAEGLPYDERMPVGAMIEVPAAAIAADAFARRLDFLSIGTNDLIQYAMATDRLDDEVNYLYDPLHPGVLRLIHNVIVTARAHAVPVSMCGEMAGDTRYTRLLLGMGLRDFSMHAASLLEVKRVIQSSAVAPLARVVRRILRSPDPEEIVALVAKLNALPD